MTSDDDRIAYLAGDRSGALDDALDDGDRADLDDLKALLSEPSVWATPPAELEDAVVAAVGAEAEAAPPASRSMPTARSAQRSWRRAAPWIGAAAAAVVLAVGLVAVSGQDEGSDELVVALAPPDSTSDLAGSATLTRSASGWRIELDAPGLPRLDDGRFYEAWMRSDDDVVVSLGTFNEGEDVVLWGGVPPREFPTITVTREEADGDPSSSGDRVLSGQIVRD